MTWLAETVMLSHGWRAVPHPARRGCGAGAFGAAALHPAGALRRHAALGLGPRRRGAAARHPPDLRPRLHHRLRLRARLLLRRLPLARRRLPRRGRALPRLDAVRDRRTRGADRAVLGACERAGPSLLVRRRAPHRHPRDLPQPRRMAARHPVLRLPVRSPRLCAHRQRRDGAARIGRSASTASPSSRRCSRRPPR